MLQQSWLRALVSAFFLGFLSGQTYAQNYTWTSTTGGSWSDGLNWGSTPGDYPNSPFTRATFSASVNSSPMTVTFDSAITLRRLVFSANQSGNLTIAPGTGGSLTFDDPETGQPSLNVNAGSGNHTIAAGITIQGPIAHKWSIGANQTLTVNGSISGTQSLIKLGEGTLLLNGTNTYSGATTVSLGTLGGSGSIASTVMTAAGTTLRAGTSASTPALTLNNTLSLGGRYLVTLFADDSVSRIDLTAGTASIGAGSLELELASGVTLESFRAGGPRSYTILDAGDGQLSGTFTAANFTTAGFAASEWTVVYDNAGGNVVLNFTPVPEPATVLSLAAGGLLVGWRMRRRIASSSRPVHGSSE
jgi:autotransporter-associated beta strand protein